VSWNIKFTKDADKQMKSLDSIIEKRIHKFINERLIIATNPKILGIALRGDLSGLWRFKVGDYRLICDIEDNTVTILVVLVGHRKNIYK
jgi:mRNA interferase RelE/StbE